MPSLTLLDIAKMNGSDDIVPLIEENMSVAPEFNGAGRTIAGTSYNSLVRDTLPGVGFRNANEGVAGVKSIWSQRLTSTFIVNARIEMDKAVADSSEDGPDAVIAREASGVIKSMMLSLGSQMYYGVATTVATSAAASPTKGFPGLVSTYDSTNLAVDAGGAGSDTSSVWGVKWGPDALQWVVGRNGMFDLSALTTERVLDGSDLPYTAYVRELLTYVGLQQVNKHAVGRIRNIDTGSGLSDDDIAELLSLFPVGMTPDALYMNRRSLRLLRSSRTATISSGGTDRTVALPFPDSSMGIPIIVTDSIKDTETSA